MAIGIDVFNSTLQQLDTELVDLFGTTNVAFENAYKSSQKMTVKGPYHEFVVNTGGPGGAVTVRTGNEPINSVRKQHTARGNDHATRVLYHYVIPARDFADAEGADGVKILMQYPVNAIQHMQQEINKQLVRGAYSAGSGEADMDFSGLCTLWGGSTYTPDTGSSRAGFFEAAAPSAQTNIVHGLAGSGAPSGATPGWHNQYEHITSMENNGRNQIRQLINTCSKQGVNGHVGPHLGLCDQASFTRFLEITEEYVRTPALAMDQVAPSGAYQIRDGIQWSKNLKIFREDDLDLSDELCFDPESPAIEGITMLLDKSWKMWTKGGGLAGPGNFEVRPGFRLPDTEAFRFEIVLHAQLFSNSRRTQGLLTGTATI